MNSVVQHTTNELNQCSAVTNSGVSLSPAYDLDGNMTWDGRFSHSWDGENNLVWSWPAGATNGSLRVDNGYDYMKRRVTKIVSVLTGYEPTVPPAPPGDPGGWVPARTTHFVWDCWNIVAAITIDENAGTTNVTRYVWGLDLSGSIQGAGGVGGLLTEIKGDGSVYFPCSDANGNIADYVDVYGTVRGHFEYNAFGETVAISRDLVDTFSFRFSTKYHDDETGNDVYQMRQYISPLALWASRDPIGESRWLTKLSRRSDQLLSSSSTSLHCCASYNLYQFALNAPVYLTDFLGLAVADYFIIRDVPDMQTDYFQSALAYAPDIRDGFEVEYVPADSCPVNVEDIKLVQALKYSGFFAKPAVDTFDSMRERNRLKAGGIPLPDYVDSGGRPGNHGKLSYLDAPYWAGSRVTKIVYYFEVCAVCADQDKVLGCMTFSFSTDGEGDNGKLTPAGGSLIIANPKPTSLWLRASEQWKKLGGKKK